MNVYAIKIVRQFGIHASEWGENVNTTEWRIADDIESAIRKSKDYNIGRIFEIRVSRRDGDHLVCTSEKHPCKSVKFVSVTHTCTLSPTPEASQ